MWILSTIPYTEIISGISLWLVHGVACWQETKNEQRPLATLCRPIHPHQLPPCEVLWGYNETRVIIHTASAGLCQLNINISDIYRFR